MSEPYSPIARALLGGVDVPDKDVPCMECGTLFRLDGFLWESVKLWNREENESAAAANQRPNFIRSNEIACCDACTPKVAARKRHEYQLEINTTEIYLRDLRAGRYSPDTLRWLRDHGHADTVRRVLDSEGSNA